MKLLCSTDALRVRLTQDEYQQLSEGQSLQHSFATPSLLHCRLFMNSTESHCFIAPGELEIGISTEQIHQILEDPKQGLQFTYQEMMISVAIDLKRK